MTRSLTISVERHVGANHWEHVAAGAFPNDFRAVVYATLADVSNDEDVEPLSGPRGLPENPTRSNRNQPGQHSFETHGAMFDGSHTPDRVVSWLTLAELEQQDWTRFSRVWDETDFSVDVMSRLRQLAAGIDPRDLRIVFWIDDASASVQRTARQLVSA